MHFLHVFGQKVAANSSECHVSHVQDTNFPKACIRKLSQHYNIAREAKWTNQQNDQEFSGDSLRAARTRPTSLLNVPFVLPNKFCAENCL